MNRTLYTLLYTLALPLIFVRLWWRSLKDQRYRQRWRERLAYYPAANFDTSKSGIVFHTVSVGELHAAVPLIKACMTAFPDWAFTITTTTVTGSARVSDIFKGLVQHCYLPYDTPGAVKRFLRAVKPQLIVIMETELWPNLLHFSRQQQCKLLLLNARLSEKSFRNYNKHAALTRSMLLNLDLVAAQFEQDAQRFQGLGLPKEALQVTGTMKFDQELEPELLQAGQDFKQALARPVFVASSTRAGEEIKVLQAFQSMLESIPDLLLLLVPRHPERVDELIKLLLDQRLNFLRHSEGQALNTDVQVLVGDTMGEMQFYYACADIAFVGGSLVATGGQNIIEPALLGIPVLSGPSRFNFQTVSELLLEAGGMQLVQDERELASVAVDLLKNSEKCESMVQAAKAVVAQQSGATARQLGLIQQAMRSDQ